MLKCEIMLSYIEL